MAEFSGPCRVGVPTTVGGSPPGMASLEAPITLNINIRPPALFDDGRWTGLLDATRNDSGLVCDFSSHPLLPGPSAYSLPVLQYHSLLQSLPATGSTPSLHQSYPATYRQAAIAFVARARLVVEYHCSPSSPFSHFARRARQATARQTLLYKSWMPNTQLMTNMLFRIEA